MNAQEMLRHYAKNIQELREDVLFDPDNIDMIDEAVKGNPLAEQEILTAFSLMEQTIITMRKAAILIDRNQ